MGAPFLASIDTLRKLGGEPKVTYPEGNASFPVTERLVKVPLAIARLAFGTAELNATRFPGAVLTDQFEVGSDRTLAEVYRRYEVLPGLVTIRPEIDAETLTPVTITTQRVRKPAGGTSTSSVTIGTGAGKTWTTQASLPFVVGSRVRAIGADALNFMEGSVTSFSGTTLVLLVDTVGGSGTLTAWTFQFAGYAQVAGSTTTFQPGNDYVGTRVVATLADYANVTRTVDDYVQFNFPRLILDVDYDSVAAREGSVRTRITWLRALAGSPARNAFTAQVKMQTVVNYYADKAAADTAAAAAAIEYSPIFNDLVYDGLFWNTNERGVLNDAVTVAAFTTGTENPTWGYIVEPAVTFAASTPTASAYIALADSTPRIVGRDIKPWKYNLWRMETRKVVLR